jgi:SAGA-associated factor 29
MDVLCPVFCSTWTTTRRQLVPIPDASVPIDNPAHIDNFPQHKSGAIVRALYPETTCFYRAHVLSGPISTEVVEKTRHGKDVKRVIRHYLVQFEDDDNQEHQVDVHLVLEDSGFD